MNFWKEIDNFSMKLSRRYLKRKFCSQQNSIYSYHTERNFAYRLLLHFNFYWTHFLISTEYGEATDSHFCSWIFITSSPIHTSDVIFGWQKVNAMENIRENTKCCSYVHHVVAHWERFNVSCVGWLRGNRKRFNWIFSPVKRAVLVRFHHLAMISFFFLSLVHRPFSVSHITTTLSKYHIDIFHIETHIITPKHLSKL